MRDDGRRGSLKKATPIDREKKTTERRRKDRRESVERKRREKRNFSPSRRAVEAHVSEGNGLSLVMADRTLVRELKTWEHRF